MKTFADYGIEIPIGATGEVRAICPECGPKRKPEHRNEKDLSVNVSDGVFYCNHCEWKGGLGGNSDGYGTAKPIYAPPRAIPHAPESAMDRMYEWFLKERGIPKGIVDRNKVTVSTGKNGQAAIAFRYFRDGVHVNTTHRTYDKRFFQEPGAERIFYGLDDMRPDTQMVIICEGQIDKLAFDTAGFEEVLSVPDGAPMPNAKNLNTKLSYLESTADLFARMERIYLACDNDPNGQALNQELARRIGREKCWFIEWPEGMDANDVLLLRGPQAIREAVDSAKPYPVEGLFTVDDFSDALWRVYETGYDPGLRIGHFGIDDHYRVRAGLLSIVTGHSSHGKSLWLDHVMIRLAMRHNWRFAVYSPENHPGERHISGLAEIYVGSPFDKGFRERMTREELTDATTFLADHFTFISPDEPTVDAILDKAKIALYRYGINGLIIDPWNEVMHPRETGTSETNYISDALSRIRRFARDNSVHVWVLAHPTKYKSFDAEGVPKLNDISGSVNFRNKADYGIVIWRDPLNNETPGQCHVEKIRFRETGRPGMSEFRFNPATRQMEDV